MTDPLVGTLVKERYRIERELARGGFGAVFLAVDTQLLNRPVVLKVLLERATAEEWSRRKFTQEIEALARIHHRGVVAIVDQGVLPTGQPFMVQQFVQGITLRQAIQPGGMDLVRARQIIEQMGEALTAAHEKGVTHRDLKPENVMLTERPGGGEHVTLIDFGIASVADSLAGDADKTKVTGTFAYMAAEQFEGKPSASSDVYSLGVIAFELLAGATPAAGRPLFELMLMQKEGNWPDIARLRPSVPPAAGVAIAKALQHDPAARWSSARAFSESFSEALRSAPRSAARSPAEPAAPATSRHWPWILAGISLVVAALVVGLWLRPRGGGPSAPAPTAAKPAETQFAYSITVQRYRNGKPFRDAVRLSKPILFDREDRIHFDFDVLQDGYLYVINEAPTKGNAPRRYAVLFPSPTSNSGSARVTAGSRIRLPELDGAGEAEIRFNHERGTEKVWIVFSLQPVEQPFSNVAAGPVPAKTSQEFAAFFANSRWLLPAVAADDTDSRSVLRIAGPTMVHLLELLSP